MLRVEEKILLLASTLWAFSEGMLGPLFAVFSSKVGGNVLDISWAWAVYLIISGVGISIVGRVSDKHNKAKMMLIGYLLITIFTFGYLLVSTPLQLLLIQAGLGLGLSLAVPTWYALYDQYSGEGAHDGFVWGLAQGMWHVIRGLAIAIGGLIIFFFSFEVLFLVMGFIMLIATVYQVRILKYL